MARLTRFFQGLRQVEAVHAPQPSIAADHDRLAELLTLLNEQSQPNINALSVATRNNDILALNVKAMGYRLARDLGKGLEKTSPTSARHVGLGCKLSTQADIESDWFSHWCRELGIPPIYHRKLWEFAYVLQVLYDANMLRSGLRGLGFGCGIEPMASYFAAKGVNVMMTDLAGDDDRAKSWAMNNEHAASVEHAHHAHIVDRDTFLSRVAYQNVDMNAIPSGLCDYDFCWSICAFEHLGSIELGLEFLENSIRTLRPGGVAVHTTEFNVNPDGPTIDNWLTVLFQRKHIEAIRLRLEAKGHKLATVNFDAGNQALDEFIDLPPWHDGTLGHISAALGQPYHLKVGADGFVATCIGLAITKGS